MIRERENHKILFATMLGRWVFYLAALLATCLADPAVVNTRLDDFFGSYRGLGVAEHESGAFIRNFSVTVLLAEADGFKISWTTERRSPSKRRDGWSR